MYPLYLATTYLKVCCNREHSALEFVIGLKVVVGCLVCSTEAACGLVILVSITWLEVRCSTVPSLLCLSRFSRMMGYL